MTVNELDTNELNRRGLRPTEDGGVEARDQKTGTWTRLSKEEQDEVKRELSLFRGDHLSWVDEVVEELVNELLRGEESDLELAEAQGELVEALVSQGTNLEEAKEWVVEFAAWTSNEEENREEEDEELLALLDAPFKVLRDNTFADPERLLVWDRLETPSVQALTFEEATDRYQCGGEGSQWSPKDLQTLREVKRGCLEETLSSYAKQEADPDYEGLCSTPVLVVSPNPLRPHRWCEVKACLDLENLK